jgi:hypothetical protein
VRVPEGALTTLDISDSDCFSRENIEDILNGATDLADFVNKVTNMPIQ